MASAVTTSVTKSDSDQQTPKKVPSPSNINQQQSPRSTSTMPTSSGTYVSTGPVEVSKPLQDGEKFVKWDEVIMLEHTPHKRRPTHTSQPMMMATHHHSCRFPLFLPFLAFASGPGNALWHSFGRPIAGLDVGNASHNARRHQGILLVLDRSE